MVVGGVSLFGCSLFGGVSSPDPEPDAAGEDGAVADAGVEPCEVNGVWTLSGDPVQYTCCSDSVDIQVDEVTLDDDGAEARTAPYPTTLAGEATTCPDGTFDNEASAAGGLCAVTARLTGAFTGSDAWEGTFELTFSGCECGGIDPCVDQTFDVTGTR